jgi:hypothetical protein
MKQPFQTPVPRIYSIYFRVEGLSDGMLVPQNLMLSKSHIGALCRSNPGCVGTVHSYCSRVRGNSSFC